MPAFSLLGGLIGQGGANAAAGASNAAGWQAYNNATTQKTSNEALAAPYTMGGWAGQNALLRALGLGHLTPMNMELGTESYGNTRLDQGNQAGDRAAALADFQASPGYQFRKSEGINALDRSAASRGMVQSGAQIRGAQDYGQNIASDEWGNYLNRLAGLSGQGAGAAAAANSANTSAMNTGNSLLTGAQLRGADYGLQGANALANGIMSGGNSLLALLGYSGLGRNRLANV